MLRHFRSVCRVDVLDHSDMLAMLVDDAIPHPVAQFFIEQDFQT
jgi:hypothetical protein